MEGWTASTKRREWSRNICTQDATLPLTRRKTVKSMSFWEKAEALLAEDLKPKEEQWLSESKTLFVLRDSELTQAIQPLRKNLSLMRLLYPITQAVAALVSAALAMLLLAQRAKDTAILRVLGISRSQTRWMLGVEPVLAALLGAGLGVLVAFLILGRQALGTSCLISLGLYLAGCLLAPFWAQSVP